MARPDETPEAGRPPGRDQQVARDVLALILMVIGFVGLGVFLFVVSPRAGAVYALALIGLIGCGLATDWDRRR